MKLLFEKNELIKKLNIVQKAVSVRTTMDILECILIDATTDYIYFTGNDLDLGIRTLVEGDVVDKGQIAINAKIFCELIKKFPEGQVIIETDDFSNVCKVTSNKKNYEIICMTTEDFACLPEVEKNDCITLSQFALKEVINQTIFSLSANDLNPMMTGELFEKKDETLKVVALDSHRIALRNLGVSEDFNDIRAVIPGKSLKEVAGILSSDTKDMVNVYFGERHVLFEFDDIRVVSRTLEGKYFNINQMFSNDYETTVVVNRKDLLDAIDTEMVFIKESEKKPIIFDFKDDHVVLNVKSSFGQGVEEVFINKNGEDIKIGFNPKFLMEALKVIEDEQVTLYFVNSKSPCFIKDNDDTYLYLILPVNFTED